MLFNTWNKWMAITLLQSFGDSMINAGTMLYEGVIEKKNVYLLGAWDNVLQYDFL